MKLGIDLDGVVVDFVTTANAWFSEQSGVAPIPALKWDWYLDYPNGEELGDRLFAEGVDGGLYGRCNPFPVAIPALRCLRDHGHELTFVTYRQGKRALHDTVTWLRRHGFAEPVHFVRDKGSVDWDIHLDDHGPTVASLLREGRKAVLFRRPWNLDWWLEVPSVERWSDFLLGLEGWS